MFSFTGCAVYSMRDREPLTIPNHSITNKKTLTVLYAAKPKGEKICYTNYDFDSGFAYDGSGSYRRYSYDYFTYTEPLTLVVIGGKKYRLRIEAGFSDARIFYGQLKGLTKSIYSNLSDELMKSGLFSSIHYIDTEKDLSYGSEEYDKWWGIRKQPMFLKSYQVREKKELPVNFSVYNGNYTADYYFDEDLLQNIDTDYILIVCPRDVYYSNFSDMNKEKPKLENRGCVSAGLGSLYMTTHLLTLCTIPLVDEMGGEMMYVLIEKDNNNINLLKNKYVAHKSINIASNLLIPFVWADNIAMGTGGYDLHSEYISETIINEMAVQIVEAVSAKENGR